MDVSASASWKDRLRQERIQHNWRQQDLADQLGTTVSTIQRWERGSQQPSAYFRVKLCALFGKSAEELGLVEGHTSSPSVTEQPEAEVVQVPSSPTEAPGLWTVPYLRNPHFTGRDDLLEHLAQQLSFEKSGDVSTMRCAVLSQPQAIKRLGGIGKTQIAVEYAYRAREQGHYAYLLWINAASEEAILTSFQTLAQQLPNFAARDEKDQRKLITALLRWLEACPESWLLIFDNADELTLVQPYLPQQGRGSILLTTRTHAVSWLAASIEVEQMGLVEGTQFLLHRTGRQSAPDEECNEATNLVIALDGFPLALDQAGAYIEETGCNFGDYLQLYEQHRKTLLARRGRQSTNYPASVATTWDLSFQKIEQAQPAVAELLRLCAFLAPDRIPEELITEGATHWPALLQEAVTDSLRFNELLGALLAFSLIKRLAQKRLLSLHRLVQAVQMDRMDLEEQRAWAKRVVCAVNALFPADPKDEIAMWSQCLRYLEQVQACDHLIQQHHLQLPQAADLLDRAGIYLREHVSYGLAEPLFKRGLAIAKQQWGPEHLQVASLLTNLGILYYEQGKYEQAELLLQRAVRIWEQAQGPEHLHVSYPLGSLGDLYLKQGKYKLAEPLLQRALHIREQALGPYHLHVANALTGLANLARDQGQYEQADALYQRALTIRQEHLGPQHINVAKTLYDLAQLREFQQHPTEALSLYQETLTIREQVFGAQHPKTCETRQRLHAVLLTLSKTEEVTVLEETHIGQAIRETEQK